MERQGIALTVSNAARHNGRAWRIAAAILLFAATLGALGNMLGFAAPLLTFSFGNTGNGILLLCNRLFAASERKQLYLYTMFTVNLAEHMHEAAMGAACAVFALASAGMCLLLAWKRRVWLLGLIAAAIAGVQVYFGVFPSAMWNLALFGALELLALPQGKTTAVLSLLTAMALTAGLSLAFYPGPNAALYNSAEAVRDFFGETVENPAAAALQEAEIQRQAQRHKEEWRTEAVRADGAAGQGLRLEHEDAFAGAQAGSMTPRASWIALVTALVLAALLVFWLAMTLRKAAQRRALLVSPDASEAIRRQFALCMDCLALRGLHLRNAVYATYTDEIESLFSPALAAAYQDAAALWRECVYGGHTMTEAHRAQMERFTVMLRRTEADAGILTRARLAAVWFNGGAGV